VIRPEDPVWLTVGTLTHAADEIGTRFLSAGADAQENAAITIFMRRVSLLLCVSMWTGFACGEDGDAGQRVNTLRLVDETPDLAYDAGAVTLVRALGRDADGEPIYGPVEATYDEDVPFSDFPENTATVELTFLRAQGYDLASWTEAVDFPADDDGEIVLMDLAPDAHPAKTAFTVRIENDSPYEADEIWVTVIGKNKEKTAFYYLEYPAGAGAKAVPFGGTDDFALYSTPLSALTVESDGGYSFQCPREDLVSGRIYLSFGARLEGVGLNDLADPLSLQLPSPTGAPDYNKLWEFMELSATIPDDLAAPQLYTLYANTSVVDFFSIGIGMTMQSQGKEDRVVGFVDDARASVLAAFEAANTPEEFRNYVNADGGITSTPNGPLRVLAPVQKVAIDPEGALASFLEPAISAAWAGYETTALDIPDTLSRAYGYTYTTLPVSGGVMEATCTGAPSSDPLSPGEVYMLSQPTSRIAFECDAPLEAGEDVNNTWHNGGSDGHKRLSSLLLAAINRGVLATYTDWDDADKFFTRADGTYNHYARIMHASAIDNKVYSFGYDDIYGQDPTLSDALDDVDQMILAIPAFDRP